MPTWDFTIHSLMVTSAEYDASIELLKEIIARGSVSAWHATELAGDEIRAWIGLHQSGIIRDYPDGAWNCVRLTPYGQVYARERGLI